MTKVRKFSRGADVARALPRALGVRWCSSAALRRPFGYVVAALLPLLWMALGMAATAVPAALGMLWGSR